MSEITSQLCRFCLTTKNLTYYCENCGSSCCSDCIHEEKLGYYVCHKCNSKNIDIRDEGDTKICKNCGSEDVNKAFHNFKSCPKCSSKNVLNIYEKKEELEQKFLDMIKNTRSFAEPFISTRNQLVLLRERLKNAREPPIRCYQFPKMEKEVIMLIKMFNEVVNTLLDKINIHFHHFSLNQDYFFNIYVQPNSSIKVIENILQNLQRSYGSIQEYISKNSKIMDEAINKNNANFQLIDQINDYFLKYKNDLNLSNIEKPIYAIEAIYDNGYKEQKYSLKNKGILFITTIDLSFIQLSGRIKKKKKMIIKIPIKDLNSMDRKGKRGIHLDFTFGKYEFQLPKQTNTQVLEYIAFAQYFDNKTKDLLEAGKKLQTMDLDLNNVINFIEEAINSFFSLKCKYNKSNSTSSSSQETENGIKSYSHHSNEQVSNNQFGSVLNQQSNYYLPSRGYTSGGSFENQPGYSNNYPRMPSGQDFNNNLDRNDRNYLFRRVGRFQSDFPDPSYPINSYDTEWFHKAGLNRHSNIEDIPFIDPTYENYNKYHLSDYFVPNPRHMEESKRMRELKKERYSLHMTLKKLDEKFDLNLITEESYFKVYNELQNKISEVDENINLLKKELYHNL